MSFLNLIIYHIVPFIYLFTVFVELEIVIHSDGTTKDKLSLRCTRENRFLVKLSLATFSVISM